MAFLPPNQENQYAPEGTTTNNPQETPAPQVGGSVGEGAGTGPKGGTVTGTPTQFGSSASKLGDYLSANAPQIQNQANTVVSGLNNQYGQIQNDINQGVQQFGQQVQQGYTAPDQNVVNNALANPTGFASDPNNVKAFQNQYNNEYKGPQNFESSDPYTKVNGEINSAVQNANLLNTPAGLQSYFGSQGGNSTRASNTLDSLLLQGNPEAKKNIETAANQFKGLTDQFGQATAGANQSVEAAQKAAQDSKAYAQGQANPYAQNFNTNVQTGAQQAEAQRQAYNTAMQQFMGQATPIEQRINQGIGSLYGGQHITDYLAPAISQSQPIVNPINAANYSTPEQYQQAQALQQLLGGSYQNPLDATQVSQAGTGKAPTGEAPKLLDILKKYAPEITKSANSAHQAAANSGGSASAINEREANNNKQIQDLISYLSQYGLGTNDYAI